MERKGGRTFSLRVLLRANFVFLFSKFSAVLSSLLPAALLCSPLSLLLLLNGFCLLACCCWWCCSLDSDTGTRMRFFGGANAQSCVVLGLE